MASRRSFLLQHTRPVAPPLCPELVLHLAAPDTPLWNAGHRELQAWGLGEPFWAFCWAAGAGLARHLLDHPEAVRERTMWDVGCGCGVVALAAARAGAARVVAVDVDPWCADAVALNAEVNALAVDPRTLDVTQLEPPAGDAVLAADVCYGHAEARAMLAWLRGCAARGCHVLLAEPGRGYVDVGGLEEVAAVSVPTDERFEPAARMRVAVLRVV
jgi:predicted nicotinamide N-methyase